MFNNLFDITNNKRKNLYIFITYLSMIIISGIYFKVLYPFSLSHYMTFFLGMLFLSTYFSKKPMISHTFIIFLFLLLILIYPYN